MKKLLKRSLVMTLVTVLLIGTFAISADAVAKKTVKKQKFTTSLSVANKKAAKVKKGTTNLTYTKGEGYIKFTAPSTKTYSFTFSNLKVSGESAAHVSPMLKSKYDSKSLDFVKVSTKGGKNDSLCLVSKGWAEDKTGAVKHRYLHSRTGKIKLKKGETIYFYFYSTSTNKNTMKLVIK